LAAAASAPTKVILDTDIGDDIDDAFALGLALQSPEIRVVGITTAWGDTALRARLVNRLLRETHRGGIPVAVGIATKSKVRFTQAGWARGGSVPVARIDAVDFLLRTIRRNPGEITLVAIAPLTNLGAAIDRDPVTFRRLKRVRRSRRPRCEYAERRIQHCERCGCGEETFRERRANFHDAARFDPTAARCRESRRACCRRDAAG
jgi:hypothetical protein